jgi:hypothetical protein
MPRDSSRALRHAARHAAMRERARCGSHTGTHTALLLLASKRDELAAMLPVVREIFELHASATAQALDRWCVAVATRGACCSLPASPAGPTCARAQDGKPRTRTLAHARVCAGSRRTASRSSSRSSRRTPSDAGVRASASAAAAAVPLRPAAAWLCRQAGVAPAPARQHDAAARLRSAPVGPTWRCRLLSTKWDLLSGFC